MYHDGGIASHDTTCSVVYACGSDAHGLAPVDHLLCCGADVVSPGVWAWLLLIPCALDVSGCLLLLLCLPYECHSSAFEAEAHRALVRLLRACDAGRSVARESHN